MLARSSVSSTHWSKPALAMTRNQMLRQEPEGNWSYAYFSLIDPSATDLSYSTIANHPYLYYVRMDDSNPPYRRVLFRQRVKLNWLIRAASDQAVHATMPRQQ
jgi:hypothetical protein